ncbi:MAG: NADH-quinone oxidoreductase subunit M [bacterium]
MNILTLLILSPFLGSLIVLVLNKHHTRLIKLISGIFTIIPLILGSILFLLFDPSTTSLQFVENHLWISQLGIRYYVGVDGISLIMIILSSFMGVLSYVLSLSIRERVKEYFLLFLVQYGALLGVFAAIDVLLFFVFLQISMIPIFLLITIFGMENKIYASRHFALYNLTASILLLISTICIYANIGSGGVDLLNLSQVSSGFSSGFRTLLVILLFFSFGIISGVFPFHGWVSIASRQAPLQVAVILTGVSLKVGIYGLIRFVMPIFSQGVYFNNKLFLVFGLVTILYSAIYCLSQKDLRLLVGCISTVYSGYLLLGFGAFNAVGLNGIVLTMVAHGLFISSLFVLVDCLFIRSGKMIITEFGGLSTKMPVFTAFSILIILAAIGLPGFGTFIGIFLSFLGAFDEYPVITSLAFIGIAVVTVAFLKLLQDMFFSASKLQLDNLTDLNIKEILTLLPFVLILFVLGIYPKVLLDFINMTVINICQILQR